MATKHLNEARTEIASGARVRGTIRGTEDLVVSGRVDGRIEIEGALFIESGGVVKAEVIAAHVRIAGILVGDVTADDLIEILAEGRVQGDLHSQAVRIEEGARFAGTLDIGSEEEDSDQGPRYVAPPRTAPRPAVGQAPGDEPRTVGPMPGFAAAKVTQDERRKKRVVVKKRS